jgi:hypothetical protein
MGHLLKIKCVDSRVNAHIFCNKCPIYTLDGASAKFSTNSHETDNSAVSDLCIPTIGPPILKKFKTTKIHTGSRKTDFFKILEHCLFIRNTVDPPIVSNHSYCKL